MIVRRLLLIAILLGLGLAGWGYADAVAEPELRRAKLELPGWPEGAPPIRIVLLSDIHVAGPDMPPDRLAGIVARIARLGPDLVLIAGDFVSDKRVRTRTYSLAEAVAPLKGLHPRLGILAVLGNHDHWRNAAEARRALTAAGIRLLDNEAVRAGPLAVGGLDDDFTGHDDLPATLRALGRMEGTKVLLSHSPDPFPEVPGEVPLMLAGHTHCGQIRLPWIGAVSTMSRHGDRYACGLIREKGRTLIVSAGLGTSILPLRIGAPPDFWLLELSKSDAAR